MYIPRSAKRWPVNIRGQLKLENKPRAIDCTIYDLSPVGAKLSLAKTLARDTLLKLTIALSQKLDFFAHAWVAWHRIIQGLNVYGLYFAKIDELDKEKISQFLRENCAGKTAKQAEENLKNNQRGGDKMEDRRIFERIQATFPARFIDLLGNREGLAQVQDISAKGVGFVSKVALKPFTPLEMWLEVPDKGEPLYARGEVVWTKIIEPDEYRIGVNLDRADLMGMSRILRVAKA